MRYCGGISNSMHGIVVNDHATGHFAALGILLAVFAHHPDMVAGETVEASLSQTATLMQLPYLVGHGAAKWQVVDTHSDNHLVEVELERCFEKRPAAEWEAALRERDIAAHVYRNIAAVMQDEIALSRGLSVTRDHPGLGRGREVGVIRRFASRPDASIAPAVKPGTHTCEVLRELGYGEGDIDELIARRVVATDSQSAQAQGDQIRGAESKSFNMRS